MADKNFYVIDQNTGDLFPIKLTDNGDETYSVSTDGGGSGGDASAANQTTEIARLTTLDANIGAMSVAEATTDTGTFSLIGLVKRLLNTKLKIGQQTKAASLAIVPSSDWNLPKADSLEITGSAGSLNADAIASTDVSAYAWISVQILGTWSGTITFQSSNDGVNWVNTLMYGAASTSAAPVATATANNIFSGPRTGKFFRVRMTAYTSGTATATAECFVLPAVAMSAGVSALAFGSTTPADAFVTPTAAINTAVFPLAFNANGQWDRIRNNQALTLVASAAKTATNTADITNYNGRALAITLNITAAPNTGSTITVQLRMKDFISGNYTTLLSSAAIVGSASQSVPVTNVYRIGQGITVVANVSAADVIGRTMNVNIVHSNSDSWTYSVSADIIL
jgi:hypothetical protein